MALDQGQEDLQDQVILSQQAINPSSKLNMEDGNLCGSTHGSSTEQLGPQICPFDPFQVSGLAGPGFGVFVVLQRNIV